MVMRNVCLELIMEMVEDADGVCSDHYVNGLKAALDRIKTYAVV